MGISQDIQKRIKTKESEVSDIQQQIRTLEVRLAEARAYILGLQDILPKAQRDEGVNSSGYGKSVEFRKGSAPEIVREILAKERAPMHVNEILQVMGKSGDKKAKLALVGTLSRYARQGVGFKKTAPNTFSLIQKLQDDLLGSEDELPDEFGKHRAA